MIENREQLKDYFDEVKSSLNDLYIDFCRQVDVIKSKNNNVISIDQLERIYSKYNANSSSIIEKSRLEVIDFIKRNNRNKDK
jgi:hypothetical protein